MKTQGLFFDVRTTAQMYLTISCKTGGFLPFRIYIKRIVLTVCIVFSVLNETFSQFNPSINNLPSGFGNTWGGNNPLQTNYRPDTTNFADEDTLMRKEKIPFTWKYNPMLASVFSIVPGGGQVYNGNYWKVPLVWGILATLSYFVVDNHTRYKDYREAYIILVEPDSSQYRRFNLRHYDYSKTRAENFNEIQNRRSGDFTPFDIDPTANATRLTSLRDFYRRNRDLTAVLSMLCYLLNIADAAVDAHFAKFDMSDNLSMQVKPMFWAAHHQPSGIGLQTTFFLQERRKTICSDF